MKTLCGLKPAGECHGPNIKFVAHRTWDINRTVVRDFSLEHGPHPHQNTHISGRHHELQCMCVYV
jgi:hypothetical protein